MLSITFNQIRLFEAVARHKSFTKAAEELNITQPAVSSQLKKLSASLGDPLIEVIGKKVFLTPTGETTYQKFVQLLENFEELNTSLRRAKTSIEGELILGGVSASKYFLPFILAEFLKEHPKVTPKLSLLTKAEAHQSLKTRQHELVITSRVFDDTPAQHEAFMTHTLAVVASANHRLNAQAKISLKSLLKQNLILPDKDSSIRQTIEHVFSEEGLELKPFMEMSSYALIKQSVMAGLGIGILSTDTFRLEEHTGHLVRLNVEDFPIHRHWHCAYADKKKLSEPALAFLEFLHRYPIETYLKNIYSPKL
jgi:DNA-binding transcriptional LysR family regulator